MNPEVPTAGNVKTFEELLSTEEIEASVRAALTELEPSAQEIVACENGVKELLAARVNTLVEDSRADGQVVGSVTRASRNNPGCLELSLRISGVGDHFEHLLAREMICPEVLRQALRGFQIAELAQSALRAARKAEFEGSCESSDGSWEVSLSQSSLSRHIDKIVREAARGAGLERDHVRHEFLKAYAITASRAFAAVYGKIRPVSIRVAHQGELAVTFSEVPREEAQSLYCEGTPSRVRLEQLADEVDLSVVCHQALAWEALSSLQTRPLSYRV
ncbi:hypothetical protein [Sinomonas gamaensis]|uniref:hypothetical protein n=1 Tax=Sinomonas gamaensis TaxID=2565624 RepID=UPI00110A07D1|nr:hypothetical protein [Sinomonas gamaensis]